MYKQSKDFNSAILGDNRKFYTNLIFGNTGLVDSIKNVKKYSQLVPGSTLSIGGAISSYITMDIWQPGFQIEGKEFDVYIGIDTDSGLEWCSIGKYTATTSKTSIDGMVSVTAYDRIHSKMSGAYFSSLTYPTDAKNVLNEISSMTGVPIDVSDLESGVMVNKVASSVDSSFDENGNQTTTTNYKNPFDGFTYREALGYVAMLFCKYAVTDRNGGVKFVWYSDNGYELSEDRYYDDFSTGDKVFSVGTISCNTSSGELLAGSGTTNIQLENPVMTQERLSYIYNQVKDLQFIPVSLSFLGDIRVEAGDIVTMKRADGTAYRIPVMNIFHDFDGGLKTTVQSYGGVEEENSMRSPTVTKLDRQYAELFLVKELIGKKASLDYVYALSGEFKNLKAENAEFVSVVTENLKATNAEIENVKAQNITTENLSAKLAEIGALTAETADIRYASIEKLEALEGDFEELSSKTITTENILAEVAKLGFLDVRLSNIDTANIDKAVIATMFVELGLIDKAVIDNGHVTGYLNSVLINANLIKAGTLSVDRLVINGSEESLIFALNNAGELTSESVNTIDGGLITPRTITADHIVAGTITANEITSENIVGSSGWINLAKGTFNYGGQLVWDGTNLYISGESVKIAAKEMIDDLKIGARNLVRNSNILIFEDYYFELGEITVVYENGNVIIDYHSLSVEDDEYGNVTFNGVSSEYEDGNVLLKK